MKPSYISIIHSLRHHSCRRIALMVVVTFATYTLAQTQFLREKYSVERPLKVSCDMEFYPFEFMNDEGNAIGFNIELMKKLFSKLSINYDFLVKEKDAAQGAFEYNETNLVLAPVVEEIPGVYYGKFEVASFRSVIVSRKGVKPVRKLSELKDDDIVYAKKGGYSAEKALHDGLLSPSQIRYASAKVAIEAMTKGECDYIIGGGKTMEHYIDKYNLSNSVVINSIDIPAGKIIFASRDKSLILALDAQCNSMEQSGEMFRLTNKWIYGNDDEVDNSLSVTILFITFGILLFCCVLLLINRIVNIRLKHTLRQLTDTNNIIQAALSTGGNYIICSNIKTGKARNLYGNFIKSESIDMKELFANIHSDDREGVKEAFKEMHRSKDKIHQVKYRYNFGTKIQPQWRSLSGQMALEEDKGKTINVYTTLSDITLVEQQEAEEHNTSEIYEHIFEMSIVGMAIYNTNGTLVSANTMMKKILDPGKFARITAEDTLLFDLPALRGNFIKGDKYTYLVCTNCDLNGNGKPDYIDFRCRPVLNDKGDIAYYMVTARDMKDEREMYRQSRMQDEKIRRVSYDMEKYENELKILLEEANMMVWRSNVEKQTFTLYRDLRTLERRHTMEDCVNFVMEEDKKEELRRVIDPTVNGGVPCDTVVLINKNLNGEDIPTWHAINSVPEYDNEGKIKGCFGLIRDIDELINAQISMKKESERAQDSARLKSVFLANMTHEIRTPLNAIVGFCDVLQAVESAEERGEFLKIILNNCDLLIQLINDILVISELDSNGLSLKPAKVDFADSFHMICTSLKQRVQDPNVKFISVEPYDHLEVTIDINRIHQVITNFLTNAVKYTHQGHITLGYERRDNGLYIYCEDTGAGIPADKHDKIFGRFVKLNDYIQGAGLGLSICKAIAEKCGGQIGVESEVGKGSTFWIWIPETISTTQN